MLLTESPPEAYNYVLPVDIILQIIYSISFS